MARAPSSGGDKPHGRVPASGCAVSVFHASALPRGYLLSDYTIESVLGHGGFGITYLAQDTSLGAHVAIKEYLPHDIAVRNDKTAVIMPKPSRDAMRDYQWGLNNFVKEARALAKFKHPHIVRVLRFIETNGTAYTVMEYEKGRTLAQLLKRQGSKLDEPTLLKIIIPILNGLHAVHKIDMLHLDIKPENIYLAEDNRPLLIDFGSARQRISETGRVERIALTPGYAPMEQYPDKGQQGPWTDIYAIGATMYRCLTGKRPGDALERYRAVLQYATDPLKPAAVVAGKQYQQALLECVDWALQIYPKDRPQSAREMQDGLMGKRRGNQGGATTTVVVSGATTARAPGIKSWVPVNPRPVERTSLKRWVWFGLVLAGMVAAAVFYWPQIQARLPDLLHLLRVNKSVAVDTKAPDDRSGVASAPSPQNAESRVSAPDNAHGSMRPKKPHSFDSPPRTLMHTLSGHQDWVQSVAFSPDGTWVASGSTDKTIRVWDSATGSLRRTVSGPGFTVNAVAVSRDGKRIASAGVDGTIRLWDPRTGAARGVLQGDGYAFFCLAFSPDGDSVAAAGKGRTVYIWDVGSGKRRQALDGHSDVIYAVAFSPDRATLASAGADRTVRIWNIHEGKEAYRLVGHKDEILALTYAPDGRQIASGDAGSAIRLWSTDSGGYLRAYRGPQHAVLSLAYTPDGRWLAIGSADNTVQWLDLSTGRILHTLTAHRDYVQSVAISSDGAMLASASRDGSVKLWIAADRSSD